MLGLTELKNKEGLNNLIKKFAVNPSTGLIDINQAISKVTKNTIDEVVRAIRNNYEFDTNMSNYDIDEFLQDSNIPKKENNIINTTAILIEIICSLIVGSIIFIFAKQITRNT